MAPRMPARLGTGKCRRCHSDGFSNPVLVPLFGLPVSRAMWFNFIGFTADQRPAFAVYVSTQASQ